MCIRSFAVALTALAVGACGTSLPYRQVVTVTKPPQPQRTAAAAQDLRAMMAELAVGAGCRRIRDLFRPLGGGDGGDVRATGTLWITDCEGSNDGANVTFNVGAKGWQWISRTRSEAGAEFRVNQYIPFEADIHLNATVDVDYDTGTHLFMAWLTPTEAPRVSFRALQDVQVNRTGLWSNVVAALATVFTTSPEQRADIQVAARGTDRFRQELAKGLTFAVDLCTTRIHTKLGTVSADDIAERRTEDDTPGVRASLHTRGLLITGPMRAWKGEVAIRVSTDERPVRVRLMCLEDAHKLARAFLKAPARNLPRVPALANRVIEGEAELRTSASCSVVAVSQPAGKSPAKLEYTQLREAEDAGLIRCKRPR